VEAKFKRKKTLLPDGTVIQDLEASQQISSPGRAKELSVRNHYVGNTSYATNIVEHRFSSLTRP